MIKIGIPVNLQDGLYPANTEYAETTGSRFLPRPGVFLSLVDLNLILLDHIYIYGPKQHLQPPEASGHVKLIRTANPSRHDPNQ